jgi:hypothetical protein
MKRNPGYRPETKVREALPRVQETGGEVLLMCPFCQPPHPVAFGKPGACGTTLKVTAVQTVIPIRTVHKHKLICFKCGQGGGEMVPFNQGYLHLVDCVPGTRVLAEPPANFSRWAGWVYRMPEPLRERVERLTGAAKRIDEIDAQGKETGRTLGFIFHRGGV